MYSMQLSNVFVSPIVMLYCRAIVDDIGNHVMPVSSSSIYICTSHLYKDVYWRVDIL